MAWTYARDTPMCLIPNVFAHGFAVVESVGVPPVAVSPQASLASLRS